MNAKFELERWERHWRVCRLHGVGHLQAEFELEGKNVFELGCGPVLGWGPIAIFHGVEKFWYREPDLVREALESARIKDKYFRPAYQELVSNYGRKMTFDSWYSRVIEASEPLPAGAQNIVDITISNSVLEHIPLAELSAALDNLYVASRRGSWFSHMVDFGPHGGCLSEMYAKRRHEISNLNLLRQSEMAARLANSGFELSASVAYKVDEIDRTALHETWRSCSVEDLSTRVMIFIGKTPLSHRDQFLI